MQFTVRMISAIFMFSTFAANATVVYDQHNINSGDRGAYQYVGQELADDFTALTSGTITNATWTGQYYGADNLSGSESFTFNLFAGGNATPGALLFSAIGTATIFNSATPNFFDYRMNINGPTVSVGAAYWVSIYSNDNPANYSWANSYDGSNAGAYRTNGGTWNQYSGGRRNHVFALNTNVVSVPEPGSLALLGLGLAGMRLTRRNKKA